MSAAHGMPGAEEDACDLGAPYEAITNAGRSDPVASAELVLREGWSKRGWPLVTVGSAPPWEARTPRSFAYALHAFDMAEPLLRAYDRTREARFLDPVLGWAADWFARCGEPDGPGAEECPFAWYDMAVGMRAYRLAYAFRAGLASSALDSAGAKAMRDGLTAHFTWLSDDANVAFHSNHGYYQVAGQLAAGRRLEGFVPGARRARRQARRRLLRVVDAQFAPDGIHKEHSPDYHRMVLETLRGLLRAGLDENGVLARRADGIEEALAWFVAPNGHIVNFGDSDDRDLSMEPKKAAERWRHPAMQWAVSGGRAGQRPEGTARVFPEGGYYVARAPSATAPHDPARDSYLAMTACFHSRTHKQADDLSFVWYEDGQPILIDAGRYGYIDRLPPGDPRRTDGYWYGDPMRRYVESTRAHNAITVDGRNTPRQGVTPYGSAIEGARLLDDGTHEVTASIPLHGGRWRRRLAWSPGRQLVVKDTVEGMPDGAAVAQWFQLAEGLVPEADSSGGLIAALDGGLLHAAFLGGVLRAESHGVVTPDIRGWWSPTEQVTHPVWTITGQFSHRQTDALTVFDWVCGREGS